MMDILNFNLQQICSDFGDDLKPSQGWNSDFGLDKERKKDSRQGKKDSWQGFNKRA